MLADKDTNLLAIRFASEGNPTPGMEDCFAGSVEITRTPLRQRSIIGSAQKIHTHTSLVRR